MRTELERLLTILAATGWSEKSIHSALSELAELSPSFITDYIRRIRDRLSKLDTFDLEESASERLYKRGTSKAAIDQAVKLLRDEAGLSSSVAAAKLLEIANLDESVRRRIGGFKSKEGLAKWLTKISDEIGPSELLHLATKVRSSVIHESPAWPLKEQK